jgi:hypothetical protein
VHSPVPFAFKKPQKVFANLASRPVVHRLLSLSAQKPVSRLPPRPAAAT